MWKLKKRKLMMKKTTLLRKGYSNVTTKTVNKHLKGLNAYRTISKNIWDLD
jgi:hypothetical protein